MNETKYRVWCLSWNETERDGHDVVGLDPADEWRSARGVIGVSRFALRDASDAVEAYAEYVHDNRDGWEDTWPLKFRVSKPDGTTEDFEVEREFNPTFSAASIEAPDPAKAKS